MRKKSDDVDDLNPAVAEKASKKRTYRAVIFDPTGVPVATQEVNVDEDGHFKLKGRNGTYRVTPGSAWTEGGVTRVIVNPDNPQTLNARLLVDPIMHPSVYEADLENCLATQITSVARRKPVWQQGVAWGMGIMGLVLMGLMLWGVMALGDGFEALTEAVRNMDVAAQGAPSSAAQQAGHQPIAPGGR